MLSHPDNDPMGIRYQFENFFTAEDLDYPILLVKDDALRVPEAVQKLNNILSQLGFDDDITEIISKKGFNQSKTLESITDTDLRERFRERFASLNKMFELQPLIRLLLPKGNVSITSTHS